MIYRYFVSYLGTLKNGTYDVGHVVIGRSMPIEEPDDIVGLARDIQAEKKYTRPVTILSYQLMSKVADE